MTIKLALAANNTEKCFENKVYGIDLKTPRITNNFLKLQINDLLVFYKAKEGIAGVWKVVSEQYQDDTPVWENDVYPYRVKIEPIISLKPEQYLDARTIINDLECVKNPLYWGIAFRENLKEISQKDYELIKSKLEEASKVC